MTTITLKAALEQSDLVLVEMIDLTLPLHTVKHDKHTGDLYLHLYHPSTVFFQYGDNSDPEGGRMRRGVRGIRRRDEVRYDVAIAADPNQELEIDPETGRSMVRSIETGGYYPIYFYNKTPKVEFTVPVTEPVADNTPIEVEVSSHDESKVFEQLLNALNEHDKIVTNLDKILPHDITVEKINEGGNIIFRVYIPEGKNKGEEFDFPTPEQAIEFVVINA